MYTYGGCAKESKQQPDDPRFLTTVRGFGYRFEALD